MNGSLPSSLKAQTQTRQPKFGHYVGEFLTPGIGHMLAEASCDFVFFDMEHSGFSFETLKQAVRYFESASVPLIVRVPSKDYDAISRACDVGAEGIMVPMVGDASEAAAFVSSTKYPPTGARGVALGIAHDNYSVGGETVAQRLTQANERTTCFVLIETREGAENADAIAATPGVDCIWIGHFDLSASLGIPGEFTHPEYRAAHDRIVQAAKRHGKSLGRLVATVEEGHIDLQQGFDFCCYGTDTMLYQRALMQGLEELRSNTDVS
jgi:2-keto-3-deoxy-L-rhamnonate aldolase RhmA